MCKPPTFIALCLASLLTFCPAIFFARAKAAMPGSQQSNAVFAPNAITLQPILSGLSNTVYLTNARDGRNRLFVIEKAGVIRVAQPGASTTTIFLNITSRVLSTGNEQGLLGLAFHPRYAINGRFFVYYTRPGSGAAS